MPSPTGDDAVGNGLDCFNQQVEDLAWMVRDNLHAKHLVLSIEELFVEFLECPLSEEETLALEPMESYQRMLLHHLADIFGLAHESIGEGEERHLVVERCKDSSIPAVLVSDVLLSDDRDPQLSLFSRQLLKRDTTPGDGSQTPPTPNSSLSSLEDRQAAYLAARQRIFSATWEFGGQSHKTPGTMRPRSDPVVARRMIAHALGKNKVSAFPSPATSLTPPEDPPLDPADGGVSSKCRGDSSGNDEPSISTELRESMQQSSAIAAKRIFANALSSSYAGSSPRVNLRQGPCKAGTSIVVPSDPGEEAALASVDESRKNLAGIQHDAGYSADRGSAQGSERSPSVRARRETKHARPGGAACRIFAQALGLPAPAGAADVHRPASNHQRSSSGNSCRGLQK